MPEPLCWNPRTELFSVEDVTFSSIDAVLVIAVVWVRQYAPTMIRPIDHEAFVSTAHEPCLHPVWGDGYRYSSLHEPTGGFEPPTIRLQGGRSDLTELCRRRRRRTGLGAVREPGSSGFLLHHDPAFRALHSVAVLPYPVDAPRAHHGIRTRTVSPLKTVPPAIWAR